MADLNNIATGTSTTTTADKNLASKANSKSDVTAHTRSLFMRGGVMSANETAVDSLVKGLIGLKLTPPPPPPAPSKKPDELTTFFKEFGPDVYSIVSAKTVDDLKEWARKMGSSDGVTTDNEAALLKKLDEIGRTLSPAGQALNMHRLKTMVADTFLGQAALNKMGESVNLPGVPADMQKMKTSDAEVTSSELDKMDVFIANMHRDKAIGNSAIKNMSLGLIGWAKKTAEARELAEQGFMLDYNGNKILDRNGVPQKCSGDELKVLTITLETAKNLIWGHMPPELKNYLLFNHTDTPAEIQKFKEVYGIMLHLT
jgi:hypothetical protein